MKAREVKSSTQLSSVDTYTAETIEQKIERVIYSGEPIDTTAPIIYTEKKDGVVAAYDIRTDRFEIALDGFNAIEKMRIAKSEENPDSFANASHTAIEGQEAS